jgi:hypothetical protein
MSRAHTSNTRLRRYFPPRESNPRPPKAFKLSWASIGQILSSTRFCKIYIYITDEGTQGQWITWSIWIISQELSLIKHKWERKIEIKMFFWKHKDSEQLSPQWKVKLIISRSQPDHKKLKSIIFTELFVLDSLGLWLICSALSCPNK